MALFGEERCLGECLPAPRNMDPHGSSGLGPTDKVDLTVGEKGQPGGIIPLTEERPARFQGDYPRAPRCAGPFQPIEESQR